MQFVTEPAETGLTADQIASFPADASADSPLVGTNDERLSKVTTEDPAAPQSAVRGLINWNYEALGAAGTWQIKASKSLMLTFGCNFRPSSDTQEGDIFGVYINPTNANTRIVLSTDGAGIDGQPTRRYTKGTSLVLRYTLFPASTDTTGAAVPPRYGLQVLQQTTPTALNYRGAFGLTVYYLIGDVVTYRNTLYVRQLEGSDTTAFDPSKWGGGGAVDNSRAAVLRAGGPLNRPLVVGGFSGYMNGFSDGSQLAQTYSFEPAAPFACAGVQLVFGNFSIGNSYAGGPVNPGQLLGLNPITVKVAVYNGDIFTPLTFNGGQLSARIMPGLTVKTDRWPAFIKAGAGTTVLRISVAVDNAGDKWPLGITCRNAVAGDVAHDTSAISGGGVPSYHPFAIVGDPAAPRKYDSVALVGDSIFVAGGGADSADLGWGARALNAANIPFTRMATYGALMDTYTRQDKPAVALPNLVGVGHIVCELGVNNMLDLLNGGLAAMQAKYLTLWNALAANGAKVHQTTITPYDNTDANFVALKAALNDWIRSVPAPLTSCIDAAILAETALNSNLWKPGYSNDNLHPNETGAVAISPSINPALFLL
jgi:lysophospholipase L1-like esterase